MADDSILTNSKISQVYIQANYENDKVIQKVIRLVKEKTLQLFRVFHLVGGKNFPHSASTKRVYYLWTTV